MPPDYKGFNVLQDARIIDLRLWNPTGAGKNDSNSLVYGYRHLKVQKTENTGNDIFRVIALVSHPDSQFRFPPQRFQPKLQRTIEENPTTHEKSARFEVSVDLSKAPTGQIVDVIYEHDSPGAFVQRGEVSTTIAFHSDFDAAEVTRWFLMPRGREYRSFRDPALRDGETGHRRSRQGAHGIPGGRFEHHRVQNGVGEGRVYVRSDLVLQVRARVGPPRRCRSASIATIARDDDGGNCHATDDPGRGRYSEQYLRADRKSCGATIACWRRSTANKR